MRPLRAVEEDLLNKARRSALQRCSAGYGACYFLFQRSRVGRSLPKNSRLPSGVPKGM